MGHPTYDELKHKLVKKEVVNEHEHSHGHCRWVYYEMGTMCHVKAVEGTRRDNATDLIKVHNVMHE